MSCNCGRNCVGPTLCNASGVCCIQLAQDCGTDCDGILPGNSRLQVNAEGLMELCSNVGGVCECRLVAFGTDELVDNGDGTFTHTAMDGTVVTFDVCAALANCVVEDLSNVAGTPSPGQVLQWDGNNYVPVTIPNLGDSDSLVDNGDGSYTHTTVDGDVIIIDICDALQHCVIENLGNVNGGQTVNQFLEWNGTNYVPVDPYVTASVDAGSADVTYQEPGGTPIPAGSTPNLAPISAVLTNPSPTRPMRVTITWTGYASYFSLQKSTPGITASWAVQPRFLLNGILQNNPVGTDRVITLANADLTSYESDAPTNSWTETVIIPAGGVLTATANATFVNQIAHNADLSAVITLGQGKISMFGVSV